MQLTVIMPAYNAGPFIREAINSLLNQTFSDFELWIIDDASTDSTLEIISSFSDARIKVFKNQINQGRDRIVNEFVKNILSPFFTITDADDVSHPIRFQEQLKLLLNEPALVMCGTSYTAVDEQGLSIRTIQLSEDYQNILENMEKHPQFHGPTTIMRKEVIDSFRPFYREGFFDTYSDTDHCCRIAGRFKSINISKPLYYYRIVSNSMSRKEITPYRLNVYRLIHQLHLQRKEKGVDLLEENNFSAFEKIKSKIVHRYSDSHFHRHLAFYYLYWGFARTSIRHIWKACNVNPLNPKNSAALLYIIFRNGLFYLNRRLNKKHYQELINHTK